jgi:hypothetical protein
MRMRQLLALAIALAANFTVTRVSNALEFYPITSVTSSTDAADFYKVAGVFQGPGVGFDAASPHNQIITGGESLWVTDAPGGFPSDYIEVMGPPILTVDLGTNVALNAISTWGYSDGNSNGVSQFSLRFATSAEGVGGFGTSIDYNPTFNMAVPTAPIQTNVFSETVTARYVEFTALDNFFVAPGTGAGGELPGGDRVGLGELAFPSNLSALIGDVNADGAVNINDYAIIRDNFYTGTSFEQGDLDLDGLVTEVDFRIWKDAFGGGGPSSVPEPATWALALLGVGAAYVVRRRSA